MLAQSLRMRFPVMPLTIWKKADRADQALNLAEVWARGVDDETSDVATAHRSAPKTGGAPSDFASAGRSGGNAARHVDRSALARAERQPQRHAHGPGVAGQSDVEA